MHVRVLAMRWRVLTMAALAAVLGCGPAAPGSTTPAADAVSFALPTNTGELVSVPLANAPMTVVDFFSPSCEPCRKKVPLVIAEEDALRAKGAQLVLVAVLADGESTRDAAAALQAWGVPHTFLVDSGDVSRLRAGITLLPASLVLDARGGVRLRGDGTTPLAAVLAAASR